MSSFKINEISYTYEEGITPVSKFVEESLQNTIFGNACEEDEDDFQLNAFENADDEETNYQEIKSPNKNFEKDENELGSGQDTNTKSSSNSAFANLEYSSDDNSSLFQVSDYSDSLPESLLRLESDVIDDVIPVLKEPLPTGGRTSRIGEVSSHLYRKDNVTKRILRGSLYLLKMHYTNLIKDKKTMKPKQRKLLKTNIDAFNLWLKVKVQEELGGIDLSEETYSKILASISYQTHSASFKNFISSGTLTKKEVKKLEKEKNDLMAFNDPNYSTAADREYSMSDPSIALAKVLFNKHEDAKTFFWQKLTGRKSFAVDNMDTFKNACLDKLAEVDESILYNNF